eukprot:CAMPEP_0117580358 /NCGR_PEP_ID=MMETSP0784-20121206/65154_1 /TAXON_ID=39447 /ORGANISM="" /LENGTH=523 /DNA_ID=CAMNT_0005380403 /DNA_START=1 /DNA_END=1569 /DNA_ORIENTATION=-
MAARPALGFSSVVAPPGIGSTGPRVAHALQRLERGTFNVEQRCVEERGAHHTGASSSTRSRAFAGLCAAAAGGVGLRSARRTPPSRRRWRRHGLGAGGGAASRYGLRVLLLGGAGRIGTAAAVHLARRAPGPIELILAGRNDARGEAALEEVRSEAREIDPSKVSFVNLDWAVPGALGAFLRASSVDAVLHTAGPFDGDSSADVLRIVIRAGVPLYVDVADPMTYIGAAKAMSDEARQAGTMALVSAGAFPGFSNVLALECARQLCPLDNSDGGLAVGLQDLDFAYFTAGLGGSGPVNLLITNLGFGEAVPVYRDGKLAPQMVAGAEPRRRCFFLDEADPAFAAVGERDVWSWPFPEAATVSEHLKISGGSSTGMGTAPGIWNTILLALVAVVPRDLWRARWFSEGLAWFSLPLVWITDRFVQETHAMRVEVRASDGRRCVAVQAHKSFRQCVAQSAAEFLLDLAERRSCQDDVGAPWRPGVWLPEQLADDDTGGLACFVASPAPRARFLAALGSSIERRGET